MGNMNVSPNMMIASPETRDAMVKGVKSAAEAAAKHIQQIKEAAGSDTGKAVLKGAVAGAALGAVSPLPAGTLIGTSVGAAAAAAAKAVEKASDSDKKALKAAALTGIIAGPIPALAAYAFCSGKAQSAFQKMVKFIQEHPEALLATAKP